MIFATMQLHDESVSFQIDSGSTVNILPENIFKSVFPDQSSRLHECKSTLIMFSRSELKPLGSVNIETLNPKNSQIHNIEYVVVSDGHVPILGVQAIRLFNLVTVN